VELKTKALFHRNKLKLVFVSRIEVKKFTLSKNIEILQRKKSFLKKDNIIIPM
jgi:hypothetical protein